MWLNHILKGHKAKLDHFYFQLYYVIDFENWYSALNVLNNVYIPTLKCYRARVNDYLIYSR